MKIALVGDVMLGRLVNQHIIQNPDLDAEYVWGDCLQLLRGADLRFINLECVIATSGEPWEPLTKPFHFRADPRAIDALKAARIDFVSLANNHSLDYGTQALEECIELLDGGGIVHAGAGNSRALAQEAAVLKGEKLAITVISITDNEPLWEARESNSGVFFVDYNIDGLLEPYRSYVERAIEKARKSSDFLVISAHVGPNWGPPSRAIQALAQQLTDLGVDCYWGHSNHTPQGIEIYRSKPILYSTGDFIDDYAVDPVERNDLSFLFMLDLEGSSWKLSLVPTRISEFRVNRVYANEAAYVMNRMKESSDAFGTNTRRENNTLVVSPD